jgi:putative acetyltransferase
MIEIRSTERPEMLTAARELVRAHILANSSAHDAAAAQAVVGVLPAPYLPPAGGLWVAVEDEEVLGCVALHAISSGTAELKRMYVAPDARGRGVARKLSEFAISTARDIGYEKLRLGTLATMLPAQNLYMSLGFRRIDPYRPEEFGETWFYELELRPSLLQR